MKYFLIFLISFTLITPAYAAKTVKGSVPQLQPLLAPTAGVGPNYSRNVELQSSTDSGSGPSAVQDNQAAPIPADNLSIQPVNTPQTKAPAKSKAWILVIILMGGLLAVAWVLKKPKKA